MTTKEFVKNSVTILKNKHGGMSTLKSYSDDEVYKFLIELSKTNEDILKYLVDEFEEDDSWVYIMLIREIAKIDIDKSILGMYDEIKSDILLKLKASFRYRKLKKIK